MKRTGKLLEWEIGGIIFISIIGSLLHFTFALSGNWLPLGIISAINESVWEHLKLAFWPSLFFALMEFLAMRHDTRKGNFFFFAKAVGTYIMPLVIVMIFYSYTRIIGKSILAVDISSFVVAVAIGQLVSYRMLSRLNLASKFNILGIILFVIGALSFALFTFFPPHLGIFQDGVSSGYGIP
jgi:hypothetical protein